MMREMSACRKIASENVELVGIATGLILIVSRATDSALGGHDNDARCAPE